MVTSHRRAKALSTALFFIGLALLIFTDAYWPGIMLAIGLPLALRQALLGRTYDMMITLLVFVGTFVTVEFDIAWRIFLPILFTLGASYVLFQEFLIAPQKLSEEEKEEDAQHELEEESHPTKKKGP